MAQRDVVVIGASRGGLQALRALASGLPPGLPACICVVLHVGPNPSTLPELLQLAGPLPCRHAKDGEPPLPGHIYVAPPDHHLLLERDHLGVCRGPKEHHTRPAIDPLFRSAAISHGPRVIGVVLTGSLDDGTAGLQAVADCGGLAIVQDPDDAEDPGMPRAALAAARVDACLPIGGIAPLLARWVGQPAPEALPPPARWVHEHLAMLGGPHAMDKLNHIGKPSGLICPECGGALWDVKDSRPPRLRCHTGHAFSLQSLQATQAEATEQALWSGLRALQEKERLLRRIVELDRSAGDDAHAERCTAEAEVIRHQAELLRRLVEGH